MNNFLQIDNDVLKHYIIRKRPATPLNDAHQGGCFVFRFGCQPSGAGLFNFSFSEL